MTYSLTTLLTHFAGSLGAECFHSICQFSTSGSSPVIQVYFCFSLLLFSLCWLLSSRLSPQCALFSFKYLEISHSKRFDDNKSSRNKIIPSYTFVSSFSFEKEKSRFRKSYNNGSKFHGQGTKTS